MVDAVKFAVFCIFIGFVSCDVPVNCTYDDIVGEWLFYEGERESDSTINCTGFNGPYNNVFKLTLRFPNIAIDDFGNKGYWTIVYNQGFEVIINYRKFFAFSLFEKIDNGTVINYCGLTSNGWSHDVLGKNWACYFGEKTNTTEYKEYFHKQESSIARLRDPETYVRLINKLQKSWTAHAYPELRTMPYEELMRRAGGFGSRVFNPPSAAPSDPDPALKQYISQLPKEFDWRDVNGINYVSPVRQQGACGSCYAFSSLGMLESRLRIMTNNSLKVVFSPQDVISCSEYSQGCDGGFPYVTAGKYAQDFGLVPEECDPYEGHANECSLKSCKRFYVAEYKYVGEFFGGCNEELMKMELLNNGPLTVAMEVYDDFMTYKAGIYHHTNLASGFNPFHLVNHGVLIVGYGISNDSGEKYWIVKNSWGENWGEKGYFRIRRGTNECNIESMAVSAIPIP